ncbi:MAG: serine--tRNA ligase [Fibrobacterota bacterium]
MLDIKMIRENPEGVIKSLQRKKGVPDISPLLDLDKRRREILNRVEGLKRERNIATQEIAEAKKNKEDASDKIDAMRKVSSEIKDLDKDITAIEEQISALLITVPNIPHESCPSGISENDNKEVRTGGPEPAFDFEPSDHIELGEKLGILDFKRGAKIAGAGFPVFMGPGAALERAMINWFLEHNTTEYGFQEVFPPFTANRQSMTGTGQLPKMEDDMYHCVKDDLFLIPTAEVPLTNLFRDEILSHKDLPRNICGYSACFRREAGSYGKDTKGFLRVHQFNKVEMVKFCRPEDHLSELEKLVECAEDMLKKLGLKYRVLELCGGDLSFAAAKCYDLEVWAPAEKAWLECSSCSTFYDFQARRANIRFRDEDGKVRFPATLNGSGLATPRIIVALYETYQNSDGSITVPEVLRPYMNGREKIGPYGK